MVFFGAGYNTSLLYGAAYSKYNAVMLYNPAVTLCIAPKERKPKNCSPIRKKKVKERKKKLMTDEERLLTVRKLVRPVPCCLLEGYARARERKGSSRRRRNPKRKEGR